MTTTQIGFTGLGLLLSLVRLSAQTATEELKIEVHIYNYSGVTGQRVTRAEQEAARIFEHAGIATTWLDCPLTAAEAKRNNFCAVPDAPMRLTLRLLSNSMADSLGITGDIFGSALQPANGGYGVVANVYADRISGLTHEDRAIGAILGRVVAHELGHLLLGKNAHAAAGIMRATWRPQDLDPTHEAAMSFLPDEDKTIRAQVYTRILVAATGARTFTWK